MKEPTIGMRLTKMRKERGQTRVYAARQIGIPYSTLNAYERDLRIPSDGAKVKLARYYGVTVQDLFFSDRYCNLQ